MFKYLTAVLLMCFNIQPKSCFNIDTNYPIIYENPFHNISDFYYGYSVVLYPGSKTEPPWILIGAPNNHSSCFKCGIGERCDLFKIHQDYSATFNQNSWLGAAMDINYASQRVVICSPRLIRAKLESQHKIIDYRMKGACYWFHAHDNSTRELLAFKDLSDIYTHPRGGGSVYFHGQGESGFSVHMPIREKEIVLGAPGVYNWAGTSVLFRNEMESIPNASRLRRPKRQADSTYKRIIANPTKSGESLAYDLFGYSTTSGYFYNKNSLWYVSSSPRANYKGTVYVYTFESTNSEAIIKVKEHQYGQQFGEYFGGALMAGDLNRDGIDDLIVGAPFHSSEKYNEGKIYLYLGSRYRLKPQKNYYIAGKAVNGQFGAALQYLGDLDHDGFGDVAVAAPYENEKSGVVYIFKGTEDGLEPTFCQRIVGKEIYESIRGFGVSISRAVDVDFNGYKDIAIGAYLSGHVVFLRSRPAVAIFQDLTPFVSHLDFNQAQFKVGLCFWFQLDQKDPCPIRINRSVSIDQGLNRAFLESGAYKKVITVERQQHCENLTVTISDYNKNRYDPIEITLSHEFINTQDSKKIMIIQQNRIGTDEFRPRCPVYDKYRSVALTSVKIPFALGCKIGNICKASLAITSTFLGLDESNVFVLGSKPNLVLQIDVENFGEKAYLTEILVTLPKGVSFGRTPSNCQEKNSTTVTCSVGNPLETNTKKRLHLDLDMSSVNSGETEDFLRFGIEVQTSSENDRDKLKEFILKLHREADVTIIGKSDQQSYSLDNLTETAVFAQLFQVQKFGRSILNKISVEINVPLVFADAKNGDIKFVQMATPRLIVGQQENECKSKFDAIEDKRVNEESGGNEVLKRVSRQVETFNETQEKLADIQMDAMQNRTFYINCTDERIKCSKVVCIAGPVKSGETAKILLKMKLDFSAVNRNFQDRNIVAFATQGRVLVESPPNFVQSGPKPDSVQVVSLFVSDEYNQPVALWIIILSAGAGLILLILLAFGLMKLGFFKRTRKEELEQLKMQLDAEKKPEEALQEPAE